MSRTTFFEVEILDAKTREQLCFLDKVEPHATIGDIKGLFHRWYPHWYPARQALKLDPRGKSLRDDEVLQSLPVGTTATMYFRDLGPQLGWTMVFLAEYLGPLLTYLLFYFRVPYIYSHKHAFTTSPHPVVTLACACHTFHYLKRLVETIFVHRFSHGTMPLRTIVWNCAYYWGFSAWLAYYINHPLYTPPSYGDLQVNYALAVFVMCELGNFSIHLTLNNLKNGSRSRRFPVPTKNPFTWLYLFVSCPNYTYEVGTWVGFSVMTQCVPVALYTLLGFIQMTIWARGKHKAYGREFKDYPSLRMLFYESRDVPMPVERLEGLRLLAGLGTLWDPRTRAEQSPGLYPLLGILSSVFDPCEMQPGQLVWSSGRWPAEPIDPSQ